MRCGVIFAKASSQRPPRRSGTARAPPANRGAEAKSARSSNPRTAASHGSRRQATKAATGASTSDVSRKSDTVTVSKRGGRRLKRSALVLRELATMTSAGTALDDALDTLAQALGGRDGRGLSDAAKRMRDGRPLSEALSEGAGLEPVEVALLVTAERTGRLPELLGQLAERAEAVAEVRSKVLTSLAWPIMTLLMAAFMMPIPALVKHGLGAYLAQCAGWLGGLAGAGFLVLVGVPALLRIPAVRDVLSTLADPIPGIGRFTRSRRLSLLFGALGPALDCGLPLPEALELAASATSERRVIRLMATVAPRLDEGDDLATLLGKIPGMDPSSRARIASGAQSGRLADACLRLATEQGQAYRQAVEWMGAVVRLGLTLLITLVVAASVIDQMQQLMSNPLSMVPGAEGRELERELFKAMPSLRPKP